MTTYTTKRWLVNNIVYIIHRVGPFLQKQSLIEEPIAPESYA